MRDCSITSIFIIQEFFNNGYVTAENIETNCVESQTIINQDVVDVSAGSSSSGSTIKVEDVTPQNLLSEYIPDIKENTPLPQEETIEADTSNQLSIEEKIQRARELVDKKREEKQKEESEKERQKELERRKVGQEVCKFFI